MKRICVVVCDPNQLFREGLKRLLQGSRFAVVQEGKSLAEISNDLSDLPGIDIIICGLDGDEEPESDLAARNEIRSAALRFVVLSPAPRAELIRLAAAAGVDAVLSKDISGKVLQRYLELVMLGQKVFPAPDTAQADYPPAKPITFSRPLQVVRPPTLVAKSPPSVDSLPATTDPQRDIQLSERESQVLRCLVEGLPNKRIARDLDITEATVKVHIKGLLRKLRANNRTQAAIWGLSNGYAAGLLKPVLYPSSEVVPLLRAAP